MTGAITDGQYRQVQAEELGFWDNFIGPPIFRWGIYDNVFFPYLKKFGVVADVGCGPVPYFFNHNVEHGAAFAVDPLMQSYLEMKQYKPYHAQYSAHGRTFEMIGDVTGLKYGCVDALFCLNCLDHVQNPALSFEQMSNALSIGGRFYLYVDIDKKPDNYHPHTIERGWLASMCVRFYDALHCEIRPHHLFNNKTLWFVGVKNNA
jgi:SAM-dependent methyltransferase